MMENLLKQRADAVRENYKVISEQIAAAAEKSGRTAEDIRFMAVTKTVEPALINCAIECGINLIGENRVQEYLGKRDALQLDGVEKHLIGHLQTNKVRQIIGEADMIQSVDSIKIAREIAKQAQKIGKTMPVLLEVNIGGEESKYGFSPETLLENLGEISRFKGICVEGLMTIPPICEDSVKTAAFFSDMSQLFIDIQCEKIDNVNMNILSMGMSGDFVPAIEHGANLVRIGSLLFGPRIYR